MCNSLSTEGTFTNYILVCAKHSGRSRATACVDIRRSRGNSNNMYSLLPGGHVTVHFNQLVVADTVTISKYGLLTLCEVDVLGTMVDLTPEGLFNCIFPSSMMQHGWFVRRC